MKCFWIQQSNPVKRLWGGHRNIAHISGVSVLYKQVKFRENQCQGYSLPRDKALVCNNEVHVCFKCQGVCKEGSDCRTYEQSQHQKTGKKEVNNTFQASCCLWGKRIHHHCSSVMPTQQEFSCNCDYQNVGLCSHITVLGSDVKRYEQQLQS